MAKQPIVFTQEGYNELKEELNYLKNVRRAEIIHDIEVARGFGDLSENAEYDEARTEQAKVEARIKELEERLRNAEIIDEAAVDTGVVSVGSTVLVYDPEEDEEVTYVIVGSNEINVFENRISDLSPIGKALIGHHAGSTVSVETPRGSYQLEIRSVERTRKN
ncbi:MAG: transcription elongation factor GreA [Clostridia bacterium]|nr:transcription elongation factor GreA [Clostridia bacterium]MBP5270548.1 transcription elongation factor GreA [Clostridia bacterium]